VKTVTRRDWDPDYARSFKTGQEVFAYNRSPRARGIHIATIKLTAAPTYEPTSQMPDSDYDAEGFRWLYQHPDALPKSMQNTWFKESNLSWESFVSSRSAGEWNYVIRFELVGLTPAGEELKRQYDSN
jgi:hypothetical protein